ncbi:hypothetical protein BROUX41_000090 [Berkeleyomyces rouxiae]|uniref:uncharacterized protein n=1 Tax=Berkeleyomyces rouxiae TaxID=2035830 RepID=UPI003B76CAA0
MSFRHRPPRAEPSAPTKSTENSNSNDAEEEEEDDYMTMSIMEPTQPTQETSFQRTQRLKKEAMARGRPKSKAELAHDEAVARDAALSTSLLDAPGAKKSKGLAMMAKMGFAGGGLGKKTEMGQGSGRAEPIRVEIKSDKGGIGLEAERKRKLREEAERLECAGEAADGENPTAKKKPKVLDPLEYRNRLARERETERIASQVVAAQRIALRLDEDGRETAQTHATDVAGVNVLWRGLVKTRREAERQKQLKRRLDESLSAMHGGFEAAEDDDDRMAMGKDVSSLLPLDEDEASDDKELEEFEGLEPARKLNRLLVHLRETHRYCLWCKSAYPDAEMDGCPGITEEEHD